MDEKNGISESEKGLVIPVTSQKNEFTPSSCCLKLDNESDGQLLKQLKIGNVLKKNEARLLWNVNSAYPAVCVVGLGESAHDAKNDELERIDSKKEAIRNAAAVGVKTLSAQGVLDVNFEDFEDPEAAAEGAILGGWKFQEFKNSKKRKPQAQCSLSETARINQGVLSAFKRGVIKAESQNFARYLMEMPANLMTPEIFAGKVQEALKGIENMQVIIHKRDWIEKENMGAFLSVSNGSKDHVPPVFLEIHYKNGGNKKPYVLVGKGITFDSGGISLKPSGSMDLMRADMGGAACVAASLKGISELKLPVNVIGLVPLTENLPSGCATKPGDIVFARNGKSICVNNTDAEGRLVLADALCYSKEFDPAWVIDMATLTGAMKIALADAAVGVFSNSDDLWHKLEMAGYETGDRMWRMPLWKRFTSMVTNKAAYDLNNISDQKGGGSCSAAAFLREFVPENTPWMHLDIAGVMDGTGGVSYLEDGMSGRPTRAIIEFISKFSS